MLYAYIDDEMLKSIVHVLRYSCSRYHTLPFISIYLTVCIDYFYTLKLINILDVPEDLAIHCSFKRLQHWSRLQRSAVRVREDRVRAGHRQKPVRLRQPYQHHQHQRSSPKHATLGRPLPVYEGLDQRQEDKWTMAMVHRGAHS